MQGAAVTAPSAAPATGRRRGSVVPTFSRALSSAYAKCAMAAATRARAWALTGENRLKNLLKPSESHRGASGSRSPRGPGVQFAPGRRGPFPLVGTRVSRGVNETADRTRTRLLTYGTG
jgi:hypothetical protein